MDGLVEVLKMGKELGGWTSGVEREARYQLQFNLPSELFYLRVQKYTDHPPEFRFSSEIMWAKQYGVDRPSACVINYKEDSREEIELKLGKFDLFLQSAYLTREQFRLPIGSIFSKPLPLP